MSGTQHDDVVQGIESTYEIGKKLGSGGQADIRKHRSQSTYTHFQSLPTTADKFQTSTLLELFGSQH